jgi:ketosteroid isomerase-like protein
VTKEWKVATRAAALLLTAVAATACNGERGQPLGADEAGRVAADAEAAVAAFFEAANGRDTDRYLAHYHAGPELVQVACTTVRRGYDGLEPMLRMWHGEGEDIQLTHQVIRSEALGRDAAVVAAQGRNQEGLALFWTFVLRRDAGGEWRIVQEHQSWPDCREPRRHP